MGIPKVYGAEIPARGLTLLEGLYPIVEKSLKADDGRGSLTATFLLSMAMPMIILPFERFDLKHDRAREIVIDREAVSVFRRAMKLNMSDVDWIHCGNWAYYKTEHKKPRIFLVPNGLPEFVEVALNEQAAIDAKNELTLGDVAECFRHSLAHGNVAYLDEHGRTSYDGPASYLAFVCDLRRGAGSQILRLSLADFHRFLIVWGRWLQGFVN